MAEAEETAAPSYEETLRRGAETEKAVLAEQIAEEKAAQQAGLANIQKARAGQKPEYERFKQKQLEVEQMAPPPVLEKPPPAPRTQEMIAPTSMERMVGMTSIFALLSVGMAKGSAIYGLKALGGFLSGAHAGNLEQADAAIKDYNNEMKRVHDANEYSRQQYLDVFNNKKYTLEMQEHAIHLKALEMKDELMIEQYRQKGMAGIHNLMKERAKIDFTMGKEMRRSQEWEVRTDLMKQKLAQTKAAEGGYDLSSAPVEYNEQGKNEKFLAMLSPADQVEVKAMANYELPSSGFGGMGVKRREFLTRAAKIYDKNFVASMYGVRAKTRMEYAPGGNIGTGIQSINAMTHHIDQFATAFKKLNNSQIQKWNDAANKTKYNFGDPALTAVQIPATAVADEIAKILKGGKASATEEDMKLWREFYTTNLSPSQAKQLVWSSLEVAGGRLHSLQEGYRINMGGEQFPALYPDTVKIINKYKPKNEPEPDWLKQAQGKQGGTTPSASTPQRGSKVTREQAIEMVKKYGSAEAAMKAAREQGLEF